MIGAAMGVAVLLGSAATARAQFDLGLGSSKQTAAAPAGDSDSVMRITTEWSKSAVAAGDTALLAIVMDIDEPYHLQLHKPQLDWLVATEVSFEGAPAGVFFGDVQWPQPHPIKVNFGDGPQTLDFYAGRAVIFHKVTVGEDVAPGEHPLTIKTTWQACDETTCLPPQDTVTKITLNVVAAGTPTEPLNAQLFDGYTGGSLAEAVPVAGALTIPFFGWDFTIDPNALWLLLVVAAIGGFLLNLTPCVLPLIPIKIMSLSAAAGNRSRCLMLGAVMSAGVVSFWLVLGAMIATISGFSAANQLFQIPQFTIGVGLVIAVMAAGMMGLFATRLPQWVYMVNPSQETVHGSFAFGIMTAILSTPCTAPFMGAAAAWAATQSPVITMATFTAIGVGMALPYLALSAWPKLVEKMPRSGPASELIKQVMGLLMMAAAAYFVGTGIAGWLVTAPDPPTLAYWYFVAFFIAAAGAWLAWRTIQLKPTTGKLASFVLLGVLFIATAGHIGWHFTRHGPIDWVYYTPERLETAHEQGKVVVLEFTAQWCLNCHALEQAVLMDPQVVEALNSNNVAAIKVDLTGNNPAGNAKLIDAGRRTIPLLVVLSPDGTEVFKSDAYTIRQVLDAIQKAQGKT